jgi:hypothetical protein
VASVLNKRRKKKNLIIKYFKQAWYNSQSEKWLFFFIVFSAHRTLPVHRPTVFEKGQDNNSMYRRWRYMYWWYLLNHMTDKLRLIDWSMNVCRISLQNASPGSGSVTFSHFFIIYHCVSFLYSSFLGRSLFRYYVNELFQINKQHITQSSPCGNTCAVKWTDAKWPTLLIQLIL